MYTLAGPGWDNMGKIRIVGPGKNTLITLSGVQEQWIYSEKSGFSIGVDSF